MEEEKVYIKFDLSDEEMIREAISMPEVYEDMLTHLLKSGIADAAYHGWDPLPYEDEFMVVEFI